nr:hypothetical protein [Streptomyces sp. ISL-66]
MRIPVGLALALAVGVLWWWAVLRLTLAPAEAGPLEGAVAVGGWGPGVLPVHCVPGVAGRRRRAAERLRRDAGLGAGLGADADAGAGLGAAAGVGDGSWGVGGEGWGAGGGEAATRASRPHRSGEGSGPS